MDEFGSIIPDPEDLANERSFLQVNSDQIENLIRERAKLFRISYQALRAEGFDNGQALAIIGDFGPNLGYQI